MSKPKGLKETDTFIVYTPGKVGSSTVINALASVGLKAHRCYPGNIKDFHYRDAPTITMVRDPIAWLISNAFEDVERWFEENPGGFSDFHLDTYKNADIDTKIDIFLEAVYKASKITKPEFWYLLSWFDQHYRPITGVNVYGQPFPKTIGYKIYSIRGLVLNTHKLSDNLAEALCEFLPIYTNHEYKPEDFTVEHRAEGTERFGSEYQEFIDNVQFPVTFLNEIYTSKYCSYFFTKEDRRKWAQKWIKK